MATILPYRGVLPKIDESTFVAATAVITGDVEIGPDTGIWYGCVVRGDVNAVRIGAGVNIQDGTIVHVSRPFGTIIGDRVTIGHMALIHACTLHADSFVGMKACVMDGAVVEQGALVAAGALVTPGKHIGAGQMWAGSPARYVRDVNEKDLEMMAYIQPNYMQLAKDYKKSESEL